MYIYLHFNWSAYYLWKIGDCRTSSKIWLTYEEKKKWGGEGCLEPLQWCYPNKTIGKHDTALSRCTHKDAVFSQVFLQLTRDDLEPKESETWSVSESVMENDMFASRDSIPDDFNNTYLGEKASKWAVRTSLDSWSSLWNISSMTCTSPNTPWKLWTLKAHL